MFDYTDRNMLRHIHNQLGLLMALVDQIKAAVASVQADVASIASDVSAVAALVAASAASGDAVDQDTADQLTSVAASLHTAVDGLGAALNPAPADNSTAALATGSPDTAAPAADDSTTPPAGTL